MIVTLTFKLSPEDEKSLLTFPTEYKTFRESMEAGAVHGLFGTFDKVELRWLLEPGGWQGDHEAHPD